MDSSIFMFVEREIPEETTEKLEGEKDHLLAPVYKIQGVSTGYR